MPLVSSLIVWNLSPLHFMRKLKILSLWVTVSGDESPAVYQDATQKGKWTRFLERIHRKSPRNFFSFFRFLPAWAPGRNMSPGWAALGPSLRVLATAPWALRAWLVRRGMGTDGRAGELWVKGCHLGTVRDGSFKCSPHRMRCSLP